ncbi:MAG: hypothetical protein IKU30_04800 [Clostridia bacterium]|nr:hypothetical protein [Clostridia bacterium]
MSTVSTLGIAAPVPMGAWNQNTTYQSLNIVSTVNGAYMAKQTSTGVEPEVTSGWQNYWLLLVSSNYAAESTTKTVAVSDWQFVSGNTYSVTWTFAGLTAADLVFVSPQNDDMFTIYDLEFAQIGNQVILTAQRPSTTQRFDVGIVKARAV